MELKTIKGQVEQLLTRYPALRDNNERLFLNYLALYHSIDVEKVTLKDFFLATNWSEVGKFETVARCSRTLQEKNKNLRGAGWHHRQHLQKEVQQDLGYNV